MNDLTSIILSASELEASGEEDEAIDLIWSNIDPAMHRGAFLLIDEALRELQVPLLGTDTLMSLLTTTAHASEFLPSRKAFCKEVVKVFEERGIDSEDLDGLL